ncbi:MAG TPA: bifunctional acetate--CoA ligase family protein/GNAT family N-acetyltransferase [Chthoniobacterales bacterium]|nr:bifunctional acetate--CoA ligase family protein/GNAT family N-acetyltransferase [Chthoniobacterales bacterium]
MKVKRTLEGQVRARPNVAAMLAPRAIALVGATESPGSVGRALLENLRAFPGELFPVNPKRTTVFGLRTFSTIADLPNGIDLAVIATKARTVPQIVRDCAVAGVKGAIIISAGFKEIGEHGRALEEEIARSRGSMRIIGPNCVGVMLPHLGLNATFIRPLALPGNIGFISQSGALCSSILDWSLTNHLGFSAFISVGSMLDVNWGDLIYQLGDDPRTRSILLYMESIGDARSFLSAAREVALTKPIIVIKVGRTQAAAQAAASHTGALTGSDEVCDAAFRRAGVLRVNTIAELFNIAELLGKQPRPRGPRLAIVTNGGGPGVLAMDTLIAEGGASASLSSETMEALDQMLPPHWSHGNPVDVIGDADPDRYARAVEIVARDPGSDGLLAVVTPQAVTAPDDVAAKLTRFSRLEGKPMLASFLGGASVANATAILDRAGIPTFNYPDSAARAFCYLWQFSHALDALYETPSVNSEEVGVAGKIGAARIIQAVRAEGRTLLTEPESKELLAAYGIPTVPTLVARSEDEAVERAAQFSGPVALKVLSHTITHKTDVGGVKLSLQDESEIRAAYREIERAVAAVCDGRNRNGPDDGHRPSLQRDDFLGVTVQPMVRFDGYELILGSSIDPQFGPVLLFGAGGFFVEIFRDHSLGLPPLNRTLARRMMERTRIYQAMKGFRGRATIDLARLEEILVRFSQIVIEQPWIKEIDINPLLASASAMIALDARVVLHDLPDESALPHPVIRPYPDEYVEHCKFSGVPVTIRPIRPEDEPLLVKFHAGLSEQSVRSRYFAAIGLEERTLHERLRRVCFNDYDREIALVVERRDPEPAILAVARLSKVHGLNEAEFALLISDAWQDKGIGRELLKRLIRIAKREKLGRIFGRIAAANTAMKRVSERAGLKLDFDEKNEEWIAAREL